jgi:predicted RNA-binding Zn ribbon-like protein
VTSHEFGGVRLPDAVAGHPALEFCNTRAGWGEPAPKEYLTSADVLALWCLERGLLPAATVDAVRGLAAADPAAGSALLATALDLREAMYAVALGERSGPAWDVVAAHAARARGACRLVVAGTAAGSPARWELDPPATAEAPLLAIGHAAGELLTTATGTAVGACPGTGCGWLFTDPRRRRRWCSMAACGNREKVRRHARRARVPAAPAGDRV